ncbi:atrial natriuretic peptide receptor 1-like isoform X2 [Paramacrobiotus metropolitanus]|uniref:atrial natriuretic peptide receptor 1-like isoform X2 n=1 Tax=Paramacrobiotus metropolitanus TaxID=2943436 RepID=UPI0024463B47|nr:atrial natriuretic peptide receptor 1-like isoform X2 [Paramacrobiotus metropolitanus]
MRHITSCAAKVNIAIKLCTASLFFAHFGSRNCATYAWDVRKCEVSNVISTRPQNNITVCTIIEAGNRNSIIDYDRIAAALDIAVKHANKLILPNGFHMVRLHKSSSGTCAPKNTALNQFLEWIMEGVVCDVYIGPGCTEAVLDIYKAAEFQKKIHIAVPGPGLSARTGLPRSDFRYLIRTTYTATSTGNAIVRFLDLFNYTHTYLIVNKDDPFYLELSDNFIFYLRATRIDLYNQFSSSYISRISTGNASIATQLDNVLRDANTSARVIVILANATIVRRALIAANNLGMTDGQFLYIGVELFSSSSWGRFTWERGDKFDSIARFSFKSLILLSIAKTYQGDSFKEFSEAVQDLALEKYGYQYGVFDQVDPIVMGYYDAIVLFSTAIRRLYDANLTVLDSENLLGQLKNTTIVTPLHSVFNISARGDRKVMFDMRIFNEAQNSHNPFLRIDPDTGQEEALISPVWPGTSGGFFPPDVPRCGYLGLDCVKEPPNIVLITVVSIVVLLAVGGGMAGVAYVFVTKNKGSLKPNWWRYRLNEIDLVDRVPSLNNGQSRLASSIAGSKLTKSSYFNSVSPWRAAILQGTTIGIKAVPDKTFRPTPDIIAQMNQVQPIRNSNLQRFIGLCLDEINWVVYIMAEFCQKGCLDDLLDQKSLVMDWSFKYSLVSDIAEGMSCLHGSPIQSHGYLTSLNCLIDGRLSVKICDYGVTRLQDPKDAAPLGNEQKERDYTVLLWRAPELLKLPMPKGDVYSFSIILQQIILRTGPYESPGNAAQLTDTTFELLCDIASGTSPPIRPPVPRAACSADLFVLMENCWSEFPVNRPTFQKIKDTVRRLSGYAGGNLVDHLLKRMEKYASDLEEQVAYKTQQFMEEKLRSEELLSQMLPKAVALSLVKGESVHPEFFEMVTVYFSDIVGFTNIAASGTPMDVISLLNDLYTHFDEIVETHDAYKVETIGDAYMVASGLPIRNGTIHAKEVATIALEILSKIPEIKIPQKPAEHLKIRSGMHSGSCVAGIIGLKAPRYCLFGDSINTASRMESTGEPMRIQTSQATKDVLTNFSGFMLEMRGQIEVKGKGLMTTYWLLSRNDLVDK